MFYSKQFQGGIHPPEEKDRTREKRIEEAPLPPSVVIPLNQHAGAPAEPVVSVGDSVKTGQLIGKVNGFISANIHASISGKVTKIIPHPHPLGFEALSVIIKSDGEDQWAEDITGHDSCLDLTPEEIRTIVLNAGIVGLGGAGFPTNVKLSPPKEKKIEYVIVNGAECEPFLTADHRNMVEKSGEIIEGLRIIMKTVSAEKGIIGIERNKPDAIREIKKAAEGSGIKVLSLRVKYPQGGEKQMIKSILNREVKPGGLPMDVGVVVQNVGTTVAVREAVKFGRPLIKRVITVSGPAIKNPKNLLTRIGTSFSFLVEQCRGVTDTPERVIMGGPMMGMTQYTLEVPVIKGTSGIILFPAEDEEEVASSSCIRCGRCVNSCPLGLNPSLYGIYHELGMTDRAEMSHVMECMECGICTYLCPAHRKNMHFIRALKSKIRGKVKN